MSVETDRPALVTAHRPAQGRAAAYSAVAKGLAWGVLAVVIWAGSFVLTRFGVKTTLNAYDITALRFATAGLLMLPVVWRRGFALDRLGWPGLLLLIAGTGAPYTLLIAVGLLFAPAFHAAALVPGPMAVMAAILAALLLRERMAPLRWSGAGLILAGSLLIGGLDLVRPVTPGENIGHGLFLLAALLWAGYVIVLRQSQLPPLQATAIVAVGSCLLYLPVYLLFLPVGLGKAPLVDIAVQAIYQGALTTLVGLVAFNRAVLLLGAAGGAAMPALVPVATLAMGAVFLGEIPNGVDMTAALLVGAGVLLVTLSRALQQN